MIQIQSGKRLLQGEVFGILLVVILLVGGVLGRCVMWSVGLSAFLGGRGDDVVVCFLGWFLFMVGNLLGAFSRRRGAS